MIILLQYLYRHFFSNIYGLFVVSQSGQFGFYAYFDTLIPNFKLSVFPKPVTGQGV